VMDLATIGSSLPPRLRPNQHSIGMIVLKQWNKLNKEEYHSRLQILTSSILISLFHFMHSGHACFCDRIRGDVQTSKQHMFGRAQTGSQGSAVQRLKLLKKWECNS
jgi:hypothetical protein